MDPERDRWSSARKWALLIGGIVVYLVVYGFLEDRFRKEPQPAASTEEVHGLFTVEAPEVRRLDDGGVEIRHDYFRRTTIRLGEEDAERALLECLTKGIEQTFAEGVEDWDGARVRRETRRIQDACMSLSGAPVPPLP